MSIRPVDLQILVQRSAETSQAHHDPSRAQAAQHHFAEHFKKGVDLKEQHVNETNKSEEQAINRDGRNKNSGGSSQKRSNEKNEIKEKKPAAKNSDSFYDFSV